MWEVTPELQRKIYRLMYLKYMKHKKIVSWTWFFLVLYTVAIFIIFTQYVYENMFVYLDFYYIRIWYDVWGWFWFLTIYYLLFVNIYLSFTKRFPWNKMEFRSLFNILKIYYFLFNFFLIWPALFTVISDFPFGWNLWKVILWLSPILFYCICFAFVDFVRSGKIVRGIFKSKDVGVRSCPGCHSYIMKKPIRFCPHCWNDSWALDGHSFINLCRKCGFFMKVKETDFPNFCPHCGLSFKLKHPRTYS